MSYLSFAQFSCIGNYCVLTIVYKLYATKAPPIILYKYKYSLATISIIIYSEIYKLIFNHYKL